MITIYTRALYLQQGNAFWVTLARNVLRVIAGYQWRIINITLYKCKYCTILHLQHISIPAYTRICVVVVLHL